MTDGISKPIYYFSQEGKINLPKTVELVVKRALMSDIKHIIVFTGDGEGAFKVKDLLGDSSGIQVYAATFPYKQVFHKVDKNGKKVSTFAGTSQPAIQNKLKDYGITLVQGVMPLQDILIPGAKDVKNETIHYTLSLISGGLRLCIQAILMSVDGGYIEPNEMVIAMSADTAIIARSSISTWLFHPTEGLEITEIICKPSKFTITRSPEKGKRGH